MFFFTYQKAQVEHGVFGVKHPLSNNFCREISSRLSSMEYDDRQIWMKFATRKKSWLNAMTFQIVGCLFGYLDVTYHFPSQLVAWSAYTTYIYIYHYLRLKVSDLEPTSNYCTSWHMTCRQKTDRRFEMLISAALCNSFCI